MIMFACSINAINTRIIKQDSDNITFEIDLSTLSVNDKGDYVVLSGSDMLLPEKAGSPKIPYLSYNIAVPSDGTINVSIQGIDQEKLKLNKEVVPVTNEYYKKGVRYQDIKVDKPAYERYSPLKWLAENKTTFREYTLIPLKIYPIDYNYYNKELVINRKMLVNVQISGSTKTRNSLLSDWESLYSAAILNWDSGKYFVNTPERDVINYSPFSSSTQWFSFKVNKDGIYTLTKSDLSTLPIDDIDPRTIRIFSTGGALMSVKPSDPGNSFKEVPLLIEGENDGQFDSSDKIILYAQDRDGYGMNYELGSHNSYYLQTQGDYAYYNPNGSENTYWITWGGSFTTEPQRITTMSNTTTNPITVDSCPALVHIESESIRPSEEEENMYLWFSNKFDGSSTAEYNIPFTVSDVNLSTNHNISLMFKGNDYLAFHVQAFINNTLEIDDTWTHNGLRKSSSNSVALNEGANNLKIKVIRTTNNELFLNFFDIVYNRYLKKLNESYLIRLKTDQINQNIRYQFQNKPSENINVFKVNSFDQVYRIEPTYQSSNFAFEANGSANTLYYVTEPTDFLRISQIKKEEIVDLSSVNEQFDYIIVAPRVFSSSAQDLKNFYQEKYQVKAKIAFQEDIFNQFSGGNPDPMALRKYFKFAFSSYPSPKIKGAVLVGMGTNDWRNYSGVASEKNKVINAGNIPDNGMNNNYSNNTSSDQYFGYFSQNRFPEIAIGRIPAINQTELNNYLNKLTAYNENLNGLWKNRALFLADDNIYKTGLTDTEHTEIVQYISTTINPVIKKTKIFSAEYDLDEFRKKPQVKQIFIDEINAGALFSTYIGHGSYTNIGDEQYLSIGDVAMLNNLDKLTVFIAGSCSVGLSDSPYHRSLSETITLHPNGGSIASIAALRESWGDANQNLITPILKGSLNTGKNIGESFVLGCIAAQSINTLVYQLLGDPLAPTVPPTRITNLVASADTSGASSTAFQARQTVNLNGNFDNPQFTGEAEIYAYDSDKVYTIVRTGINETVSSDGKTIFKGKSNLNNGQFNASFIVPDDINGNDNGKTFAYFQDTVTKKDYINALYPINFAGHNFVATNDDVPVIKIYLESKKFRDGDKVNNTPMLIADLSDENGINILGSAGHEIMLVIDKSTNPLVVTEGFSYDANSHKKGTLYWQLDKLETGMHSAIVIAFDNFNRPAVSRISFEVVSNSNISLDNVLIYPNPVKKDAYFTFNITEDAEVNIQIYTITGRKIKTIKQDFCSKGYNQIFWDGKDNDGDRIANNTYFYKIKAKQKSNGKSVEKIEKLMILN